MAQYIHFVDHLQHYYNTGQNAPIAQPQNHNHHVQAPYIPAPVFVGGGGGGLGRHVQVIASTPGALRELRDQEQEDRNDSRATKAAVLGGIGTIVLAGLTAFTTKICIDSNNELEQAKIFRQTELPQLDQQIQTRLRPILDKHIKNLESKSFWSKAFTVLTVGLLACAVAAFAGGMMVIPWLITAAIIAGVILAAAGAFSGVWYLMTDHSLSPEMVQELQALAQR